MMTKRKERRRGFTLVELIVVLMILVALAGLLVPAITDMVTRSYASSGASNISECANAVQRYEAQYLRYPNDLDSLKATLLGNTVGDFSGLSSDLQSALETVALDANTLLALQNAGISSATLHTDPSATVDATFQTTTPAALLATSILLGPTAAQQQAMGLETTGVAGKYVVLGIGGQNTMIGKTVLEAPVHFPENGTQNPAAVYSRFLAVFQILNNDAAPVALDKAQFVGVMAPQAGTLNTHLESYFQLVNQEQGE